jgi:rare lipoprotein A
VDEYEHVARARARSQTGRVVHWRFLRIAQRALLVALMIAIAGCSSASKSTKPVAKRPAGKPGVQTGLATWYGGKHHGGPTASGERFDKRALTAAHRTLKMNTRVRVTNRKNGKSVIVRINDRGPFGNAKRIIDVSEKAAEHLDMIEAGVVPVIVEVIK